MKRKLICLTMGILMLLTCVLGSCGLKTTEEDPEEDAVDNSAKTIVMWVMYNQMDTDPSDGDTDETAQKLVNEQFTKLTEAKFKTKVVIKYCTEDEYYEKLEEAFKANRELVELEAAHDKALRKYIKENSKDENGKSNGKSAAELTEEFYALPENAKYLQFRDTSSEDEDGEVEETEAETWVNDYGIVQIKYPDPKANQVDIFYLSGYERYMEYYNKEYLSSLNEELATSSKKLNDYISTSLLEGVKIDGGVYAIPNNVPIGEYTYMMIDYDLYDKYPGNINNIDSVLDLGVFLNDMLNYNKDNGKTADDEGYVVPLASTLEECLKMMVWYWELSYTDRSVYETYYDESTGRDYVLQKKYKVVTESTEDGKTTQTTTTEIGAAVVANKLYKVNDDGLYVDINGEVLNYRYATDADKGWVAEVDDKTGKITKTTYDATGKGALYLVDEDGYAVTPENDRRVVLIDSIYEPSKDENGKYIVKDTDFELNDEGKLTYDGKLVEISDGVTTAYDTNGRVKPTYIYGFDADSDFSILGSVMKDPAKRTRKGINLDFNNLFASSEYRELYADLMEYEYNGYYGEVKDGQTAAVSFVKGDARVIQEYEKNGVYVDPDTNKKYHVIIAEYPEATDAELYGNMFAVYANSTNLARSMEVITYLNTNTEMRNLLQYGIKGTHYEIEQITEKDENGVEVTKEVVNLLTSTKTSGTYSMDIEKTGNCFIATPTKEQGADAWVYAKLQNNNALINPLLGFDFNTAIAESEYPLDVALIDHVNELSEDAKAQIMECTNREELVDLMTNQDYGLSSAYSKDEKVKKAIDKAYDPANPDTTQTDEPADTTGASPYAIYYAWLTQYGYAYVPVVSSDR